MRLIVLGSGSLGNCYILENDNTALIIEAGLALTKVKQALGYNISKVVGCLISHEHGDHAKYAIKYAEAGIDVYASAGTLTTLSIPNHRSHTIKEKEKAYIGVGQFAVTPFNIKHDAKEPLGFLISHAETGMILFITDTYYLPYRFKGGELNQVIIEANYDEDIINDNMTSGKLSPFVRNRTIKSHMSIETCMEALAANNLTKVNNIVLIHLSHGNSDPKEFKNKVELLTGKTVTIAEKETIIEFNKTTF
jgi:phosphoribosyl 1,2-cyclic phosphodiesterase